MSKLTDNTRNLNINMIKYTSECHIIKVDAHCLWHWINTNTR